LTFDGDPLDTHTHDTGFALGRRRVAHSSPSDMGLFSVFIPVAFALAREQALKLVILVMISVLVAGILHLGSVATAHLQTHRRRYQGWQRREAVEALRQHVRVRRRDGVDIMCCEDDRVAVVSGPSDLGTLE
jgi:hypothetical protein